jgi:hypothetical protein
MPLTADFMLMTIQHFGELEARRISDTVRGIAGSQINGTGISMSAQP